MRKHIDYYYKCYDRVNFSELEKKYSECFNEYGYNFDSNKRREIEMEEKLKKTNYNECINKLKNNGKL